MRSKNRRLMRIVASLLVIVVSFVLIIGTNIVNGSQTESNELVNNNNCTVTSVNSFQVVDNAGSNRLQVEIYVDGVKSTTLPGTNQYFKYTDNTSSTGKITITTKTGYALTSAIYKSNNKNSVWAPVTDAGVLFNDNNDNSTPGGGDGSNNKNYTVLKLDFVSIALDKNASASNQGERFFDITLNAQIGSSSVVKNADVVMVLDASGSMPWLIEEPEIRTTNINSLDKTKTDNTAKGWDYTYYVKSTDSSSYGEYIPIAYIENMSDAANYSASNFSGAGWYRIESDGDGAKKLISKITGGTVYSREYTDANGQIAKHPTKLDRLYEAVEEFVNELKINSPESRLGIAYFNKTADGIVTVNNQAIMVDSTQIDSLYTSFQDQYNLAGGTNGSRGLNYAQTLFNTIGNSQDREKYVIYFTDGNDNDTTSALNKGNALKSAGINIYTVGLYGSSVNKTNAETFLKQLSSDPDSQYYKMYTSTKELDFDDIYTDITGISNVGVVKDYIDPRFELVDANGAAVTNGASIYGGIYKEDDTGKYLQWNISSGVNWSKTITVKAKADFIGGNAVPTNTSSSGITITNGVGNGFYAFPIPTVNVPISTNAERFSSTIFYGENLASSDISNLLGGAITDSRMASVISDLLASGASGIDYTYGGDSANDKFGRLEFTMTPDAGFDSNTEGVTKTYNLSIAFIPDSQSDRLSILGTSFADRVIKNLNNTQTQSGTIYTLDYTIHVVKGELTITRTIDKQFTENNKPYANQSFVYKIQRYTDSGCTDLADTFYEVLSFSSNNVSDTFKSAVIKGLKKGYYKITEESDWSYKYDFITVNTFNIGEKINDNYFAEEGALDPLKAVAGFTGNRKNISGLSDVASMVIK